MGSETYEIVLDDIFEGPMDLLIHLIRKNEVDIYDIPIALVTDQYLSYLDWMKSMNIDFAGDFLLMAATLAQIKSRMLLPLHGLGDQDDEDPRLEITRPLLEYLQMKSAAADLASRNILGEQTFARKPCQEDFGLAADEQIIQVGLFELIDAFKRILDNVSEEHRVDMTTERISVRERIGEIIEALESKGSITFGELFTVPYDKAEIVVTFLALLEMVKLSLVRVAQYVQTGIIRLFYI
jgi:segregation and condensation protein A